MISASYSPNGLQRVVTGPAYHDGECRHKSATTTCHSTGSSVPVLSNLMKSQRVEGQSVSKSRSRSSPLSITLTLLLAALIFMDFAVVASLPILGAKPTEIPSSDAPVPKHHHRHHHRHHAHRDRNKHHHKQLHLESLEVLDTSGSLSIVTPLDVLRQNMILEIQRKRLRVAKDKQVKINSEFLERIG